MGAGGVSPGPGPDGAEGRLPGGLAVDKEGGAGGIAVERDLHRGHRGRGLRGGRGRQGRGCGGGRGRAGAKGQHGDEARASTAAAARAVDEALRRAAGVTVPRVVGGAVGAETAAGSTALAEGVADDTPRGVSEGNGGGRLGTTSATATGPLEKLAREARQRAPEGVAEGTNRGDEVVHRGEALGGVFREAAVDQGLDAGGISTVGLIDARVGTSSVTSGHQEVDGVGLVEGHPPREHLGRSITRARTRPSPRTPARRGYLPAPCTSATP